MSITDLYEGSKSRKSSGFSEGEKSRNCSGLGDGGKSRNCSGNSISQGLVSSGFLSSNPVNIPGTDSFILDRYRYLPTLLSFPVFWICIPVRFMRIRIHFGKRSGSFLKS